jgi:hypothetical protein
MAKSFVREPMKAFSNHKTLNRFGSVVGPMKPGRFTVVRPFSTGDFKYRLERLKARMDGVGPNEALLQDEGDNGCLRVAVRNDSHNQQVAISYGFVMPDSAHSNKRLRAEMNEKGRNGDLDAYHSVHISHENMDKLVAWWIENKPSGEFSDNPENEERYAYPEGRELN